MDLSVPPPPPAPLPPHALACTSSTADGSGPAELRDSSASTDKPDSLDLESGTLAPQPPPPDPDDAGDKFATFYFFVGFFAAALLLPFAFLFLLCPDATGLVGRRKGAFVWGAAVGMFAAVGVVALHFFVGYAVFVAWWFSKYDVV